MVNMLEMVWVSSSTTIRPMLSWRMLKTSSPRVSYQQRRAAWMSGVRSGRTTTLLRVETPTSQWASTILSSRTRRSTTVSPLIIMLAATWHWPLGVWVQRDGAISAPTLSYYSRGLKLYSGARQRAGFHDCLSLGFPFFLGVPKRNYSFCDCSIAFTCTDLQNPSITKINHIIFPKPNNQQTPKNTHTHTLMLGQAPFKGTD